MRKTMLFVIAMLTASFPWVSAQEKVAMPPDHGVFAPGDIKWADAPPILPSGAKIAALKGDASKEGIFVLRLKVPAG